MLLSGSDVALYGRCRANICTSILSDYVQLGTRHSILRLRPASCKGWNLTIGHRTCSLLFSGERAPEIWVEDRSAALLHRLEGLTSRFDDRSTSAKDQRAAWLAYKSIAQETPAICACEIAMLMQRWGSLLARRRILEPASVSCQ